MMMYENGAEPWIHSVDTPNRAVTMPRVLGLRNRKTIPKRMQPRYAITPLNYTRRNFAGNSRLIWGYLWLTLHFKPCL